jgi:cytochrome d ubiquinol oxidase subunit II
MKAPGELEQRARKFARSIWILLVLVTIVSLLATIAVRHTALNNYIAHPVLFLIPVLVIASLAGVQVFGKYPLAAFLSSCAYLIFMLVGAATGLYPAILPSSTDAANDITIAKSLSGPHTLHVGLVWWSIGMVLAIIYFCTTYFMFRGKVPDDASYGH